jgi:hypothetical protein
MLLLQDLPKENFLVYDDSSCGKREQQVSVERCQCFVTSKRYETSVYQFVYCF